MGEKSVWTRFPSVLFPRQRRGALLSIFLVFSIFHGCHADCISVPGGLVSWWSADGTATDIAAGHDAQINGTFYTLGKVGDAFNFAGANYVSVPDSAQLNPTEAITIECCLYRSNVVGGSDPVASWQPLPGYQSIAGTGLPYTVTQSKTEPLYRFYRVVRVP